MVDIPDLKRLDPRRDESRKAAALDRLGKAAAPLLAALRGAVPKAAAAALLTAGAFGGGRAYQAWRDARLALGGVRSTIRPTVRAGSARLALAAQASRGELAWSAAAVPDPDISTTCVAGGARAWAEALALARPSAGPRAAARAVTEGALAQLRVSRALSGYASSRGSAEDAAQASHGAFAQRLTVRGSQETLVDSLAEAPKSLATLPAPDVAAAGPGRNVTPYQDMLDRAYADAREAAGLKKRAPRSLALGAALLAAGRAMLGAPGGAIAAKAMLAAGAAATSRGLKQTRRARELMKESRELVQGIRLLQGQTLQAGLAEACIEAVSSGAELERCRADAPPMTAFVRGAVDRELGESAAWEVEGGRRLSVLPD